MRKLSVLNYLNRHLPDDPEVRFRARLLFGILLTIVALTGVETLFFLLVAGAHMDEATRQWSLWVIGALQFVLLGLTALLLRGHYRIANAGTAIVTTLAILSAVFYTSGIPTSPALPLLLSAAVTCFCLLGMRVGIAVGIALPLLAGLQWYVSVRFGWFPPALQSRKNPVIDVLLINGVNYLTVMVLVVVYERINAKLRVELDAERRRLAHFAAHDELTGLANRRFFHQQLELACARSDRGGHAIAVLYIDLDGFKQINDALGHRAGDEVLAVIATRLKNELRRGDLVARLGGDEFAVIVDPVGSDREIAAFCARLREVIAAPLPIGGSVGASIGVALYPSQAASVDHLLSHADAEMYRQKRRGQVSAR